MPSTGSLCGMSASCRAERLSEIVPTDAARRSTAVAIAMPSAPSASLAMEVRPPPTASRTPTAKSVIHPRTLMPPPQPLRGAAALDGSLRKLRSRLRKLRSCELDLPRVAVADHDLAVGVRGHPRLVRHQDHGRAGV